MFYYLLTCLLGTAISIYLYMLFHRRYHERNLATADHVEYCDRYRYESHSLSFRILSKLTLIPFLVAFFSPLFLEYGSIAGDLENGRKYYLAEDGKYREIAFAVWDNSTTLFVPAPIAWNDLQTKFVFVVERDGRMRRATVSVGFRYPQDPEVFAKIPKGLRHINGASYGDYSPEAVTHMRQLLRFIVENDENIKYNLASINSSEREELRKKFRGRFNDILSNQASPFGIRAEAFSVNVWEF